MPKRAAERDELTDLQRSGDLDVSGDIGDGSNQNDASISVGDQGARRRVVVPASKRRGKNDGTIERIYRKSPEDAMREELKKCIAAKLADLEKEDEGEESPQEDVQMVGAEDEEEDLGGGGGKRKTRKRKSRKRKSRKRKSRKRKTRKRKSRKRNKRFKRRKKTRKRRR